MATIRSIQATRIANQAAGTHDALDTTELHGRMRMAYFSWESTAATTADVVELTKVPAGARILGIYLNAEALGQSVHIGDAGDADRLIATLTSGAKTGHQALRTDTTAHASGEETIAIGYGYTYTSETMILLTPLATLSAGANFRGHIEYVVD